MIHFYRFETPIDLNANNLFGDEIRTRFDEAIAAREPELSLPPQAVLPEPSMRVWQRLFATVKDFLSMAAWVRRWRY